MHPNQIHRYLFQLRQYLRVIHAPTIEACRAFAPVTDFDQHVDLSSVVSLSNEGLAIVSVLWWFPFGKNVMKYTDVLFFIEQLSHSLIKLIEQSKYQQKSLPLFTHLSSPTMMNGIFLLNAIRVSRTVFLGTTCCTQIGLYLLTLMSNTKTLPSVVSAAKTVLEYGAHLTSPTLAPRSNINSGSLAWWSN